MYTTNNGRTLNVTLRHYVNGVMHFEDLRAEQHILDWQLAGLQKTATGYGKKIPTSWKVHYEGRLRRIYQDGAYGYGDAVYHLENMGYSVEKAGVSQIIGSDGYVTIFKINK